MHVSDVFRPRLPLDPFGALNSQPPWRVQLDLNPGLSHTILLLGAPSHTDLAPLSTSSNLACSLLIIATHTPPPIPPASNNGSSGPSIIILRLTTSLDIHDSGALRLVSLLERAQRVAQTWQMTSTPQPRLQQFSELFPGGEFSIAEEPQLAVAAVSPASFQRISADDSISLYSLSPTLSSPKSPSKFKPLFSAIVNFLPPALPDKALLKISILVTTISTSFLAAPSLSQPVYPSRNKRLSFLSSLSLSSRSNDNLPRRRKRLSSLFSPSAFTRHSSSSPPSLASPASCSPSSESLLLPNNIKSRPHLVHVLPYPATTPSPLQHRSTTPHIKPIRQSVASHGREKSKFVESLEQFVLSFAYPLSTSVSSPALVHHTSHLVQTPPSPSPSSSSSSSSSSLATTTIATGIRTPIRSSPLAAGTNPSTVHARKHSGQAAAATIGAQHHRTSVMIPYQHANASVDKSLQAVPYILPAGVFGARPSFERNQTTTTGAPSCCIGELILLGMLDDTATGGGHNNHFDGRSGIVPGGESGSFNEGWPRAWIGSSADVEFVGLGSTGTNSLPLASVPSPVPPPMPAFLVSEVHTKKKVLEQERGRVDEGHINGFNFVGRRTSVSGSCSSEDSKVRRNEAGLPTPPESTSSSDGGDGDGESEYDDDDSDQDQVDRARQGNNPRLVLHSKPPSAGAPFLSLPSSSPRPTRSHQVHDYHYKRQPYQAHDTPDMRSTLKADIAPQKASSSKHGFKMRVQRILGLGSTVRKGEAR